MSTPNTSEKSVYLDRQENTTKGEVSAKKISNYYYDAGTDTLKTVSIKDLNTQLLTTDVGIVTNSVIHGKTTGGGGGFVDVKVNPSGALTVESTPTTSSTGTSSSVSVTTANITVLASNGSRLGATIYNEGTVTALVKLGSTASATTYTIKIVTDGYYEVPFLYTGIITGITASGTAVLRITELT